MIELSETANYVYNFVSKPYTSEQLRWHIWPTFPLNFLWEIFTQDAPSTFSILWCKKVKMTKNSNRGVLPWTTRPHTHTHSQMAQARMTAQKDALAPSCWIALQQPAEKERARAAVFATRQESTISLLEMILFALKSELTSRGNRTLAREDQWKTTYLNQYAVIDGCMRIDLAHSSAAVYKVELLNSCIDCLKGHTKQRKTGINRSINCKRLYLYTLIQLSFGGAQTLSPPQSNTSTDSKKRVAINGTEPQRIASFGRFNRSMAFTSASSWGIQHAICYGRALETSIGLDITMMEVMEFS